MKKRRTVRPAPSKKALLSHFALAACMILFNFALPQREPASYALLYAALACGFEPFFCAGAYLFASVPLLSGAASLCCAVQAAFLALVFALYRRFRRRMRFERVLFAALALVPFVFLWEHAGYALFPVGLLAQKAILAAFLFLLCFLAEGALYTLTYRAFRCRLSAGELSLLCLMWLFAGLGAVHALGETTFTFLALFLLLGAAVLLRNAAAVPFAAALSLPLCFSRAGLLPLAEYVIYACAALLLMPYGRFAAALSAMLAFLAFAFFRGVFSLPPLEIALTLLSCALPAALLSLLPERWLRALQKGLLFYRERVLPRIAVNRSRRAVGEQLYEVSSLFREIGTAFETEPAPDRSDEHIRRKLFEALCARCPNRSACGAAEGAESMDKLIAVGRAKGHVNLIDLPADLSARCKNPAGLLFALNKLLEEYRRLSAEMQSAREGRLLLARQARGVSDILRDIALEQSGEFAFSEEEHVLSAALASAGYRSSEIFVYGEGRNVTVSMTLPAKESGKALCEIAGRALGIPLALSEKIPLTKESACFVFRRKPGFDAAFGVASLPKEGAQASGDTHSILRIDERRFLVALSDGMGSGEEARAVSDRTLSLFESFYKAKMPSDTVLSTVNRLIAFSSEETFSCLDLAAVDLDTGQADVVKIGSPLGFVLSGEELRVLEGESLPLGMLEAVHPATLRVGLGAGDFLLFMSDGVTAAFGSSADLCAYLSGLRPLNPQSLAEEILHTALGKYGGHAEDDMTVLAVRLTQAA